MNDDCLFCKIAHGAIPSEKIFEDERVFAFLDINPVNPGHTLVIPKMHWENIYSIPEKDFGSLMERVHMLAPKIKQATHADGINIGMNNEGAAGQVVYHAHIHIIPRHSNDGHRHWHGEGYKDDEMKETAAKIRSAF